MMAAMMLPSVAPMALMFARVSRERARRGQASFVPTWIFLAGYLVAWTGYGLAAFGIYRGIRAADWGFFSWHRGGPVVAGVVVALSGAYELTPLKRACLAHCRTPVHFVLHSWREGRRGALRMGLEHGFFCVGCCWGLMLVLFSVGVMSLFWMAVIAAVIFAEKVLPLRRLSTAVSVALVALGIWIAVAPGSVPMLKQPGAVPMPMDS
jgi:predicted metal-binding membrane protein